MLNLLIQPIILAKSAGPLTLPGLIAALARDEVDSYPALRPHQRPAWHMFLVQLAALALHRSDASEIPQSEDEWACALRGLTPDFRLDEPWCLAVDDWSKPAFMQPPVPESVTLQTDVSTPDELDLLITSRNHDLKQSVARRSEPQDWLFALVSLQTSEGFGGRDNYGIARMNGGSSSRPFLGLAPGETTGSRIMAVRPGAHFRRDLSVLLQTRAAQLERFGYLGYQDTGQLGLTWVAQWPEGEQLQLNQLDIWFIEVCRRVRLQADPHGLTGCKGNSKATRLSAKHLNGALGDPWAPVHKTENKSLTLSGGDFDYATLTELLLSGNWEIPLLARPACFEQDSVGQILIAEALARGNSKTEGFKSRVLPIGGKIARALSIEPQRQTLHRLALEQINEIKIFDKAVSGAIALVAARGDWEKRKKEHYARANDARSQFERAVDSIFFNHLWARFDLQEDDEALTAEKRRFRQTLHRKAEAIFEAALPAIPCASIFRPRAEARARRVFSGAIWKHFPELFAKREPKEEAHANA